MVEKIFLSHEERLFHLSHKSNWKDILRAKPCKKCPVYEKRLDDTSSYHGILGEIELTGGSLNNDFPYSFFPYFSRKYVT
jgi:hypothetical protein